MIEIMSWVKWDVGGMIIGISKATYICDNYFTVYSRLISLPLYRTSTSPIYSIYMVITTLDVLALFSHTHQSYNLNQTVLPTTYFIEFFKFKIFYKKKKNSHLFANSQSFIIVDFSLILNVFSYHLKINN